MTLPLETLGFLFSKVPRKIYEKHFPEDRALPLNGPKDHPRMRWWEYKGRIHGIENKEEFQIDLTSRQ